MAEIRTIQFTEGDVEYLVTKYGESTTVIMSDGLAGFGSIFHVDKGVDSDEIETLLGPDDEMGRLFVRNAVGMFGTESVVFIFSVKKGRFGSFESVRGGLEALRRGIEGLEASE